MDESLNSRGLMMGYSPEETTKRLKLEIIEMLLTNGTLIDDLSKHVTIVFDIITQADEAPKPVRE